MGLLAEDVKRQLADYMRAEQTPSRYYILIPEALRDELLHLMRPDATLQERRAGEAMWNEYQDAYLRATGQIP